MTLEQRQALTAVARGDAAADLVIRNATVCNVYSGELWPVHVAVAGDRVAYVGKQPPPAREEWDAAGRYLAPGFVEPHAHPQVVYNPASLLEGVLPRGTTTLFCDDRAFVECLPDADAALAGLPGSIRWLASCFPATAVAEPHTGPFAPEAVRRRLDHPHVAATMEMGRWALLYRGEPAYLETHRLALARHRRIEGHFSGASAQRLSALAAAGVTSDHEAITAEEVVERLRMGFWVMLRHSSLRRDLPGLLAVITDSAVDTSRLMFTTDGSAPAFIAAHGFQDQMLRIAVKAGIGPVRALQMVTLNPAVYYGVEADVGGIAPGRRADLVVLGDLTGFEPERVMAGGRWVVEGGRLAVPWPKVDWAAAMPPAAWADPARFDDPMLYPATHSSGEPFPVIELVNAVITRRRDVPLPAREGRVTLEADQDLIHLAMADRLGRWITRGVAKGLAPGVAGFAISLNVAGQLLVFGRDPAAMALAARRVAELRGGMVLAEGGQLLWEFPLPLGGLMSDRPFAEVVKCEQELTRLLQRRGYPHHDPLYTLMFLPVDGLPRLRLAPLGLYDIQAELVVRGVDPL